MKPTTLDVNRYAKTIYHANKQRGWWDDPNRCLFTTLQLVNTEIAEATEADRKSLQDDKLPEWPGEVVELADTFIRVTDLAGRYDWFFIPSATLPSSIVNAKSLPAAHFFLTSLVCQLGEHAYAKAQTSTMILKYSSIIRSILFIAEKYNYDLETVIKAKLEFNRTRKDHDLEHRAAKHGKKY